MASEEKEEEADNMTALIGRLEESINNYKEEYAQLISQAEAIKTDLKQVQEKVDRSMSLLKSLGIEKDRWQETSENFRSQMGTLIGDVLLSSAFLAYAGYFDQHYRQVRMPAVYHIFRAQNTYTVYHISSHLMHI